MRQSGSSSLRIPWFNYNCTVSIIICLWSKFMFSRKFWKSLDLTVLHHLLSLICYKFNSAQISQVNKQGETQLKFPDGFFPSNCCNDESSEMIIHLQSIYKQQGRSDISCDYICRYIKAVYDLSVIITNWGLYYITVS